MAKGLRATVAFLAPNAWGPLMIGIAASGVFADFALRPFVESTISSYCSQNENSNGPGKICSSYSQNKKNNQCLSADRQTLEYDLKDENSIFTKWVARLDSGGKITALKELTLDSQTNDLLAPPIEYRFQGEDLSEVRVTPTASLRSDLRAPSREWASYSLIASIMRTAATSCQPGQYDQLLRSAKSSLRAHPKRELASYSNARQLQRRGDFPALRSPQL